MEEQKKPTHAVLEIELFDKISEFILNQPFKQVVELVEEIKQKTRFADMTNPPETEEPKPKKNEKTDK